MCSRCPPRPGRTAVRRLPGTETCGEEGSVRLAGRAGPMPRWGGAQELGVGRVFSPTYLMGLPIPQRCPLDLVAQHAGRRCGRPRQLDLPARELCRGQLAGAGDFPWKRQGDGLHGRACPPLGDSAEGPSLPLRRGRWLESRLGPRGPPFSTWRLCPHSRPPRRTHVWSGGRPWWQSRRRGRGG